MKTKNILMTLLLVTGAIAAKASGFPPELALVSQPVMVYNPNSITVYYDVENIGDYTYRGNVYIYFDPDYGYYYAEKYVKVRPGRIKRIEVEIPCHSIDRHIAYTIMPYYEVGRELYSFTTFEYFEPIRFCWHGPRTEPWVVIHIGPRPTYYHRPGTYRFYYDGFRPPMPPPGHGPGTPPPPMDPKHHTYGYHSNNGGYPANHPEWNNTPPASNSNEGASVRPKPNGGSMSSGSYNNSNSNPSAPNNNGATTRPKTNEGSSSSGRVGNSSNSSRPSSGTSSNNGSSSGRVNNSNSNSRPSGTSSSGSSSGKVNNSNNSNRPSGTSNSGRVNNSNSNSRPSSGTSSNSGSSSGRVNSSSSTRSSATSSSSSSTSSSSSNRSGNSSSTRSSNSGRGSR